MNTRRKLRVLIRGHRIKYRGLGKMISRIVAYSLGSLAILLSGELSPFVVASILAILITFFELIWDFSPACRKRFGWYLLSILGMLISVSFLLAFAP